MCVCLVVCIMLICLLCNWYIAHLGFSVCALQVNRSWGTGACGDLRDLGGSKEQAGCHACARVSWAVLIECIGIASLRGRFNIIPQSFEHEQHFYITVIKSSLFCMTPYIILLKDQVVIL